MRTTLPVVVAVAALALAAPSLAASPSAWAKSADAICAKYDKEVARVPEPKSLKEAISSTEKLLSFGMKQMQETAKLPRPAADKASIDRLIDYYGQQIDVVKRLVAVLKANDEKKMNAVIAEGNAINAKMDALAKKLGAVGCAK